VQAGDPVVGHRAQVRVADLLRLTLEHADEFTPAALPVVEALERREGAWRLRVEVERCLEQLDRHRHVLVAQLEQVGSPRNKRGA
jgi:hypothetical protein